MSFLFYFALSSLLQAISDANVVLDIHERKFEATVFFDNWVYELGLSKSERERKRERERERGRETEGEGGRQRVREKEREVLTVENVWELRLIEFRFNHQPL